MSEDQVRSQANTKTLSEVLAGRDRLGAKLAATIRREKDLEEEVEQLRGERDNAIAARDCYLSDAKEAEGKVEQLRHRVQGQRAQMNKVRMDLVKLQELKGQLEMLRQENEGLRVEAGEIMLVLESTEIQAGRKLRKAREALAIAQAVCDSRDGEGRDRTFVDTEKLDALEDALREPAEAGVEEGGGDATEFVDGDSDRNADSTNHCDDRGVVAHPEGGELTDAEILALPEYKELPGFGYLPFARAVISAAKKRWKPEQLQVECAALMMNWMPPEERDALCRRIRELHRRILLDKGGRDDG